MSEISSEAEIGNPSRLSLALNTDPTDPKRPNSKVWNMARYFLFAALIFSTSTLPVAASAAGLLDRGGINLPRGNGAPGSPSLNRQLEHQRLQPQLTARDAISIAERRYGGRAVGAKKISSPSGIAYKVRILQSDGKIRNVIIDGK